MTEPLVSVIIPAYNAAAFIAETVESALGQTYRRCELIVVDDGSTDDTVQRLDAYRGTVSVIRQLNAGQGGARNAGLRRASGDYIAFLDHDDLWLAEKLEVQLSIATRHPASGLIACDGVEFDGERILGNTLLHGPPADRLHGSPDGEITGLFYREILAGFRPTTPSQTLIPRHVVERIGPMTSDPDEPADWDYYLRIAAQFPITLHRHSLVRYRYQATSLSGSLECRPLTWALMDIRMLRRYVRACSSEDRPPIEAKLRSRVRDAAGEAYYYGRRGDMRFARARLGRLLALSPTDRTVLGFFLASWLPEGAIRRLPRWGRRTGLGGLWGPV